jgi:hypothetical protein
MSSLTFIIKNGPQCASNLNRFFNFNLKPKTAKARYFFHPEKNHSILKIIIVNIRYKR